MDITSNKYVTLNTLLIFKFVLVQVSFLVGLWGNFGKIIITSFMLVKLLSYGMG